MKILSSLLLSATISVNAIAFSPTIGYRTVDAYDKKHASSVLQRSVLYAPVWGGLYKEKWEEVVERDPNVRGVAIHLHGCGGMGYLEKIVADFYINHLGLAVITPDFLARPGNLSGCPGRNQENKLEGGKQRFRDGVFTARNPHRMSARTDDVQELINYIKTITNKPILLSGHSEGARTVYHYNVVDKQIAGAILHNQSCNPEHIHIFRMPTSYRTFQVVESSDPWALGSEDCSKFFKGEDAKNITVLKQRGRNHNPLQNDEVKRELKRWVDNIFGGSWTYQQVHNEELLPEVQQKLLRFKNQ